MTEPPTGRPPGDSSEQQSAEEAMLLNLSAQLSVPLGKRKFQLDRGWLEVDGVSESPPILAEAWAHQGPPKSAQKNKVMTDAFKLLYAKSFLTQQGWPAPQLILAFAAEDAASHFQRDSWMAQALTAQGIERVVVDLPRDLRDAVRRAQRRQFR